MKLSHRLLPLLLIAALATSLAGGVGLAQESFQDPSSAQYDAPIPGTGAEDSDPGGSGLESEIGFLPFTGLDLMIVAGVALVLTGVGFALRRLTEPRAPLS